MMDDKIVSAPTVRSPHSPLRIPSLAALRMCVMEIAVDRRVPARKRRVSRFSQGPPEHVMQVPLPREALERSDRSGESSLPVDAGQDGSSRMGQGEGARGQAAPKSQANEALGDFRRV